MINGKVQTDLRSMDDRPGYIRDSPAEIGRVSNLDVRRDTESSFISDR
jgi:hypothetical protein